MVRFKLNKRITYLILSPITAHASLAKIPAPGMEVPATSWEAEQVPGNEAAVKKLKEPNEMKRRVYVETTIASYLTARPSRDLVVAAHQELTLEWWTRHRDRFDLYISDLVLSESARGDSEAAAKRLEQLQDISSLSLDEHARDLARLAVEDAFHIAIATTQGMDFLLTWNCRHIANAEVMDRLQAACLELAYRMPTLCTPEQLMGD